MISTIIISILSVTVVILGFTTFNLLRKNERSEDIMEFIYESIVNRNDLWENQ